MDPTQIPLRDLHLPEMVAWWPLAPGWWVLLALCAFAVAYGIREAYRHWRHNAARRLALRELSRVRREYDAGVDIVILGKQLSELLRRAMLAYAPRNQVAGLTGESWLAWLDQGLEEKLFSDGPGRLLETLPYRGGDQENGDIDIDELTEAVRQRLMTPVGGGVN